MVRIPMTALKALFRSNSLIKVSGYAVNHNRWLFVSSFLLAYQVKSFPRLSLTSADRASVKLIQIPSPESKSGV